MPPSRKVEPPRRTPPATALDASAAIQDAVVRRLRLSSAASPDVGERSVLEDRAPITAVVGRKR
jgi:hypothetical protein